MDGIMEDRYITNPRGPVLNVPVLSLLISRQTHNLATGWEDPTVVISLYSRLGTAGVSKKGHQTKPKRQEVSIPRQEIRIILSRHLTLEISGGKLIFVALGRLGGQLLRLLLEQLEGIRLVDGPALGGLDAVLDPLPHLGARHLGRGGVFHEVVDGHAADAAQPALHISQADVEVLADAVFRHRAGHVHVEQVVSGDVDIFAALEQLVRRGHVLVEDFRGNRCQCRVGHPGAVMAGADFAQLVLSDVVHGPVVGLWVVLNGDLGRHATHGVDTPTMASLDEESDVGVHEGNGHGDGGSVGEDKVGVLAEFLDDGEDVVPSAAVETGGVVAELVDDFVHLKYRSDGLDQDGASDRASWHPDVILRQVEDIVPQSRLEMRLHLGEVEVGAGATLDEFKGIVEEVEAEIEQGAGDGLAIHGEMLLVQMPTSRSADQGGQRTVGTQLVILFSLLEIHLPADGVVEVHLAGDLVVPRWGGGIW